MIVLVFAVVGALAGAVLARRKQGNRLDMAHYAAAHAIAFALAGLAVTIVIDRLLAA